MEGAHHGWHHEPYSPVKNSMCKRWDTRENMPKVSVVGLRDQRHEVVTAGVVFARTITRKIDASLGPQFPQPHCDGLNVRSNGPQRECGNDRFSLAGGQWESATPLHPR